MDFRVVPVGDDVVLNRIPVLDVTLQEEKAAQVGHKDADHGEYRKGHKWLSEEGKCRLFDVLEAALGGLDGCVDRVGEHIHIGGNMGACVRDGKLGDDLLFVGLAEAVVVDLVSFPVELGVPLVFAEGGLAQCGFEVAVEVGTDRQLRARIGALSLAGTEKCGPGLVVRQLIPVARSQSNE